MAGNSELTKRGIQPVVDVWEFSVVRRKFFLKQLFIWSIKLAICRLVFYYLQAVGTIVDKGTSEYYGRWSSVAVCAVYSTRTELNKQHIGMVFCSGHCSLFG